MEVTFSLTAHDYEKAAKNLFTSRRKSVIEKSLIFPAVYFVASIALKVMFNFSAAFLVFTVIMTFAVFALLLFLSYSRYKKAVKATILQTGQRALYTKIKVTVAKNEIVIESSRGRTAVPFSTLKNVSRDREFIYLEFTLGDMLLVPLRHTEGDAVQFYKEIQSRSLHTID